MGEHGSETAERTGRERGQRGGGPVDRGMRASSFGAIATAYHRHRPGYPDAAVDWALSGVTAARPRLLDLAAGTGKLTQSLVRRAGVEVVAVEPDPAMLDVLRAGLPSVRALLGTAEAIPLPDGSVDAVLVGQAFHWFDGPAASAEIARVLRPGGAVGLLWNHDNRDVEWVAGYYDLTGWSTRATTARENPVLTDPLGPATTREFDHPVPMTVDGLLDNLGTYSWISTLPEAERAETMASARQYLESRPETSSGPFELPLRTIVVRAERLGGLG